MATVDLPTGETLEFDNNATDEQIHFAVQDYLSKQSSNQQQTPQNQPPQPEQNSWLTENVARPLARTAKSATVGTLGFAGDLAQQAVNLPGYLGNKATQLVTGDQNAQPFPQLGGINTASQAVRQTFDSITNDLTAPRNPTEQKVDQYSEMAAGGMMGAAPKTGAQLAGLGGSIIGMEGGNRAADLMNVAPDSLVRTGLNIGGSVAGGMGSGIGAIKIQNFAKDYKVKSALPKAAKQVMNDIDRAGLTPQEVIRNLKSDGGIGLEAIDIVPNQAVNINEMGQIAASRKVLENSLDKREKGLSRAVNNIIKGAEPEEAAFSDLSQQFVDKLMAKRAANSKPLYEAANTKTPPISLNTAITLEDKTTRRFGDLLQNSSIQKAIKEGRVAASRFKGTSGMKYYNDLSDAIPDNDIRVLHNAQTILKDEVGKIGLTGASQEQAATKALRSDLLAFMDEASPLYKQARNIYSIDTQEILTSQKGIIGTLSKLNGEKYADAGKKIFSYAPEEISKIKTKLIQLDADKYNKGVKAFVNQKIDDLGEKPLNDLFKKPIEREKFLAMLPDKSKSGFDKFIKYADQTRDVNQALRNMKPMAADSLQQTIPQRNIAGLAGRAVGAIIKPAENFGVGVAEKLLNKNLTKKAIDPKETKLLVDYLFTDEGMQNLQQLSKLSKRSEIEAAINQVKAQSKLQTPLILNAEQNNDNRR